MRGPPEAVFFLPYMRQYTKKCVLRRNQDEKSLERICRLRRNARQFFVRLRRNRPPPKNRLRRKKTPTTFLAHGEKRAAQEKRGAACRTMPSVGGGTKTDLRQKCAPAQHFNVVFCRVRTNYTRGIYPWY